MAKKKVVTADKPSKLTDLVQLHKKGQQKFFDSYHKDGYENKRYRRGQNWDNAGLDNHTAQDLKAYSMPVTVAKMNGIEAQQMLSPFAINVLPRTVEWEIHAEAKNAIHIDIYEEQSLEEKLADWYRSGMSIKYGITKRSYDYNEHLEGDVKVENVEFDHYIWDDNCRKYDIARYANWGQEFGYSTRDELKNTYPDKAGDIDLLPDSATGKSENENPYANWSRTDKGQELIKWVKHEQRKRRRIWKVTFNNKETKEFDAKQEINDQIPQERWIMDAEIGTIYPISQIDIIKESIECTVFTETLILEEKEYESKYLSYHMFCGYYLDGDIACLMDWCKHPQRFIDRTTSQFDKSLGLLIKNSYQVEFNMLRQEDKDNWQALEKKLLGGGAVIFTQGAKGEKVIHALGNDARVPPDIFTAYQYAIGILEELTGGKESFGLTTPQNQTKGGIEAIQQAGFTMAYIFIFNLKRSYKSLSEGIDEMIGEIYSKSLDRVIDITDNDLDELVLKAFESEQMLVQSPLKKRNFLKVGGLDLKRAQTKIHITKGNYAPTLKEQKRQMWQSINQTRIDGGEAPYPSSIWVKDAFDIPPTITAKMKAFEDEQAKIAEEQREMEKTQMVLDANSQQMDNVKKAHDSLVTERQNEQQAKEKAGEKK